MPWWVWGVIALGILCMVVCWFAVASGDEGD